MLHSADIDAPHKAVQASIPIDAVAKAPQRNWG
jgi:hypothetical protein